jgi:hypothetical protein
VLLLKIKYCKRSVCGTFLNLSVLVGLRGKVKETAMMQFVRNVVLVGVFASFCAGIASAGPTSNHLLNGMKAADGLLVQIQGRCEALRRACENRDVLGERGEGNCRRYRERCGRYRPGCAELRRACLNRDERGERGEGNCRRYREQCRG